MVASSKYTAPKQDEDDSTTTTISARSDASLNPAHDREIDLRQMDEQEVKSLHESDPFMYYSIPGVLDATRRHQAVDYSDIMNLSQGDSQSWRRSSRPSQLHEQAEDDVSKVSRRARVSFECPSSVIMEDIMGDFEQEDIGDFSFDLDEFLSMHTNGSYTSKQ